MANYSFFNPIQPGKTETWKQYVAEMTGPRKADLAASRQKAGIKVERVWLQHTPMGDFAIVYWEADSIEKVFHHLMTSTDAIDQWFRESILVGVHGMSLSAPPPPMNEQIIDNKF